MIKKWSYEGKDIENIEELGNGVIGFVYCISFDDPCVFNRSKYMGRKQILSFRKIKKGKRELALMTDKRGSKYKQVVKESDWKTYTGSCKDPVYLEKIKEGKYKKEIIALAYSKKELTYLETKLLFVNNVLESDEYFNSNILGKFFKQM